MLVTMTRSGLDPGLFQIVIEDVLADDDVGLAVRDLVLDLDAGVDRADGRDLGPDAQGREIGDHILGAVQQVQGHGIPFLTPRSARAVAKRSTESFSSR